MVRLFLSLSLFFIFSLGFAGERLDSRYSEEAFECRDALTSRQSYDFQRLREDTTWYSALERFLVFLFVTDRELAAWFKERLRSVSSGWSDEEIFRFLNREIDKVSDIRKRICDAFEMDEEHRVLSRVAQLRTLLTGDLLGTNRSTSVWSILDIGAGNGEIVAQFASDEKVESVEVFGVEVSESYRRSTDVNWLEYGDQGQIPLLNSSIHLVTILMVLHHIEDPQVVLDEVYRVLVEDGVVLVRESVVSACVERAFSQFADHFFYSVLTLQDDVPVPANYRSKEEWDHLFKESGFEVVRFVQFPIDRENPFLPAYWVLKKIR